MKGETVPWSFQSSFQEALPERSRKEVERSAQRRPEDAQRALRRRSEALRGRSEAPQRTFRWLTGKGVRATLRLTATTNESWECFFACRSPNSSSSCAGLSPKGALWRALHPPDTCISHLSAALSVSDQCLCRWVYQDCPQVSPQVAGAGGGAGAARRRRRRRPPSPPPAAAVADSIYNKLPIDRPT